jgi:hypothetical protein
MAKLEKAEPEFHPDAWDRFKRAVQIVAKSPPQHRTKKAKKLAAKKKPKR